MQQEYASNEALRDVSLALGYIAYTLGGSISLSERDLNAFSMLAREKSLHLYVDRRPESRVIRITPTPQDPH